MGKNISDNKCLSIIALTLIIILINSLYSYSQITAEKILLKLKKAEKFEDIFNKIGEVQFKLSDYNLLAEITKVSIAYDGKILIIDEIISTAFLFDSNGRLVQKIDQNFMEKFHPGIKFRPYTALFDNKGFIYIHPEIAPKGILYQFDDKLNYLGKIEFHKNNNTSSLIIGRDENIVCYLGDNPDNVFLKEVNIKSKKFSKFGNFPKQFKNALFRHPVEGLAVDLKNILYQVNPIEPKIYVYNSERKLINTFDHTPKFYKEIQIDVPERWNASNLPEIKKQQRWTWTVSIHFIEPSFLIVQYFDQPSKKFFLELFDINGKCYTNGIEISTKILATSGSSVYIAHQPEMGKDGNLPNPHLIQYKLNLE